MAGFEQFAKVEEPAGFDQFDESSGFDQFSRVEKPRNPVADVGSGINKTLIQVAGFPVDLANKALGVIGLGSDTPFLGTKSLEEFAGDVGAINVGLPETRAERVGKVVGSAVPGVGIVGGLAKATSMTAPILQGFRAAPGTFAATEAIAATGSAIGGEVGREQGEVGEVIGQIIGGIGAPFAVSTAAKLPTFRLAEKAIRPFTKTGGVNVAGEVIQRGVKDKALTVSLAEQADLLPGQKLTLGGQAGSSRLLSIEKAVARKLPELADDIARNEAETNLAIRKALETSGDVDNTVLFFEGQKIRVENALRARMSAAVSKMDESVSKLSPKATRADASRIISRELEDALSDARVQEKEIWSSLDGTQKLGLTETRQVFDEFITKETPLPAFVKSALKGKKLPDGSRKIKIMDFKDVRELRSKILRVQSSFRSQGNAEEAFILQQINKGILKDISNSNLGPDFSNAVTYSRSLNDKFTRGSVGNVLRFSPRGGRAVPPELVSEELLSTTAPKAATATRAARTATGDNQAMEDALVDSVKTKLFKSTGEFDSAAAKSFVEKKGELLNEFPGLKNQIEDAVDSVAARDVLERRIATAKIGLEDKRRSAAAIVLGANPDKRLNAILINPKRTRMLAQAVRVAKKDPAAIEGLQDAYNTELFRRGQTSRDDAFSNKILSGRSMRTFLNETKDDVVASGLYTKEDISRLNTIINTAERLEKQVLARPESAEIIASDASMIEDFILRVVGANIGAKFASGSGAPFVAAQAGSRFTRTIVEKLPFDKVTQILGEAVRNPEMMKDLLTRPTSFQAKREGLKRLNAWIATLGPTEEQ